MKQKARRVLGLMAAVVLVLVLQSCSANRQVKGSAGFQGASSDWGSSITFGVHSHGRGR